MTVRRPILRYHGGKWLLAPWIISHFEEHKIYVEPYGGAGSVLLRKERSYAEVYNDLGDEIYNLFCVLRQHGDELITQLRLTPFSRKEFYEAYKPSKNPIEQARRTVVKSLMGFATGNEYANKPTTGFRNTTTLKRYTIPSHDFANYADTLYLVVDRLKGVVIENRPALKVMTQHDGPFTLHYCDPPYVKSTRYNGEKTNVYAHEMSSEDHAEMCEFIKTLEGQVILSGYDNEIYNDCLTGWHTFERGALADGAKPRVEKLWINRVKKTNTQVDLFTSKLLK